MRGVIKYLNKGFTPHQSGAGFTLVEIILTVAILALAFCAILATYISCFVLTATSKNINIATSVTLGLIEEMRSVPFAQLRDSEIEINNQPFIEIGEDLSYCSFPVSVIPSSRGVAYINSANSELLNITISICWLQGNRVIGEDADLDGVLDAGEDKSPYNGIIDSPVELVTLIANR